MESRGAAQCLLPAARCVSRPAGRDRRLGPPTGKASVKNQRGVILIVVVWALTLLMVIAAEMVRTMRLEGLTADTYQEEVVTYYLAMAGLHRVLYQFALAQQRGQTMLSQPGAPGRGRQQQQQGELEVWVRGDGRWQSEEFGAGGYWVRVSDEGGKLNLNQITE